MKDILKEKVTKWKIRYEQLEAMFWASSYYFNFEIIKSKELKGIQLHICSFFLYSWNVTEWLA